MRSDLELRANFYSASQTCSFEYGKTHGLLYASKRYVRAPLEDMMDSYYEQGQSRQQRLDT